MDDQRGMGYVIYISLPSIQLHLVIKRKYKTEMEKSVAKRNKKVKGMKQNNEEKVTGKKRKEAKDNKVCQQKRRA